MKQKHYIDIENLKEFGTEFRPGNAVGFEVGDIIQITEKFDGSNASLAWDSEEGKIAAFSRRMELTYNNTLNGFWNFAQTLTDKQKSLFAEHPSYRVFGEKNNKNKIIYADKKFHWYVFDIYDVDTEEWLPQPMVKAYCEAYDFEYVHELYYGPFISWNHCRSFMNSPYYGERQEGIVCKNQTKLDNKDSRYPTYLKIVNEDFKESMAEKIIDPKVEAAKANALALTESIVTRNRVEKMLFKLRDEGVLPEALTPSDMKTVAQVLPKRVYEDCVKEEPEVAKANGEYFGKTCGSVTMKHARNIILGD